MRDRNASETARSSIVPRGVRTLLKYLIPIVVTLIVAIPALEIGARLLLPGNTRIWPTVYDPKVGVIFAPNATVRHNNGLEFDVTETTNEAGFLDRPLPSVPKPAGVCRVAFFGDSMLEAAQVKNQDKVQVLFEQLAKKHWPGLDVQTVAFGRSGTGQVNQLSYYDEVAQKLQPDVVVLLLVINDLADNSALISALQAGFHPHHATMVFAREGTDGTIEVQPIDPKWSHHALPWPVVRQPWWHQELNSSSRFYQWLFLKLSLLYPTTVRDLGWQLDQKKVWAHRVRYLTEADAEFARALKEIDRPALSDWTSLVSELNRQFVLGAELPEIFAQAIRFTSFGFDEFKRRGARDGFEVVTLSVVGIGGEFDKRLRSMIEPKGIAYLSQNAFIAGLGQPTSKAHWRHDGHWNEQGHIWAAEQLLEHFAQKGLCGQPPKPLRN